MAFTKAHAKIAADMLSDDARRIMLCFRNRGSESNLTPEAVDELVSLGFARHDKNILDNNAPIFVLTANGKKVMGQVTQ